MRRAWLLALILPATAQAYHAGLMYDRAAGGGGGGGLFYSGSPRERGWTCIACHVDPPGDIGVTITSTPPELASESRYEPGQSYAITIELIGEHLGLANPLSNLNGMTITVLGSGGGAAGVFSGYAAEDFHARGNSILASSGVTRGETSWSFTWTAPLSGEVGLYIGVVDGNGANAPAGTTLTDPLGDDVAMLELLLRAP